MPNLQASQHQHPENANEKVFGYRLQAGDTIEEHDVYDSTSGRWEIAPCPGLTLTEGSSAIWVRPKTVRDTDMRTS